LIKERKEEKLETQKGMRYFAGKKKTQTLDTLATFSYVNGVDTSSSSAVCAFLKGMMVTENDSKSNPNVVVKCCMITFMTYDIFKKLDVHVHVKVPG
jgi:hypothetical protein